MEYETKKPTNMNEPPQWTKMLDPIAYYEYMSERDRDKPSQPGLMYQSKLEIL